MARPVSDRPRIRVAALIEIADKIVVVRHATGSLRYHLLPGGGVDFGETLSEAVTREVREETGLEVSVGAPVLISDTIAPDGGRHIVNITFACTVVGGAIGAPEDPRVEAVDLVTREELCGLDLRPPMATAVVALLESSEPCGAHYLGSMYTPEPTVPAGT